MVVLGCRVRRLDCESFGQGALLGESWRWVGVIPFSVRRLWLRGVFECATVGQLCQVQVQVLVAGPDLRGRLGRSLLPSIGAAEKIPFSQLLLLQLRQEIPWSSPFFRCVVLWQLIGDQRRNCLSWAWWHLVMGDVVWLAAISRIQFALGGHWIPC